MPALTAWACHPSLLGHATRCILGTTSPSVLLLHPTSDDFSGRSFFAHNFSVDYTHVPNPRPSIPADVGRSADKARNGMVRLETVFLNSVRGLDQVQVEEIT